MNDQTKIELLIQEVETLKQQMRDHRHFGIGDQKINLIDIVGSMRTITVAADLTKVLTSKPSNMGEQLFIDTSTATKKLYVYDLVGDVWRNATIA